MSLDSLKPPLKKRDELLIYGNDTQACISLPTMLERDIDIHVVIMSARLCLSVRLSHCGIVPKRLNIPSYFLQHVAARSFQFSRYSTFFCEISTDSSSTGAPNTAVYINFAIFDQYPAICGKRYKIDHSYYGTAIGSLIVYALSNYDISDDVE